MIPRQEALLVATAVLIAGVAFVVVRLLRSRRHGLSIRLQVFLALASTMLLLSGGFAAVVVDRFAARAALFSHRAALDEAGIVAAIAEASGEDFSQVVRVLEASRVLVILGLREAGTRVQVYEQGGQLRFDSGLLRRGPPATVRPEVRAALAGRVDEVARLVDGERVAAAVPVRFRGEVVGAVRVTKPTVGMRALMADVGPKVALLAILLAIVAALCAIVIGRVVAAPLEQLTLAAERVAGGERAADLPPPRGREVRALTRALGSMRRELEQRHAVAELVADLSHELKNPVASIRAAAEVLEDGAADDPAAARRFAGHIGAAAERLGALSRDLMTLARLEARGLEAELEPVDLFEVAEAARDAVMPRLLAAGLVVALTGQGAGRFAGDARWLQRATENLLANAIDFSPRGSVIEVAVRSTGERVELTVRDRGPGVEPALRERLFERFVTTRAHADGTGLGLAIVRAVAESHGGRVELRDSGPGGSRFALVLPQ